MLSPPLLPMLLPLCLSLSPLLLTPCCWTKTGTPRTAGTSRGAARAATGPHRPIPPREPKTPAASTPRRKKKKTLDRAYRRHHPQGKKTNLPRRRRRRRCSRPNRPGRCVRPMPCLLRRIRPPMTTTVTMTGSPGPGPAGLLVGGGRPGTRTAASWWRRGRPARPCGLPGTPLRP